MPNLLEDNPFSVQSPDDISAKDVHDLFVDVFSDFEKLPLVGHTFIHGPRGSGKSMMFRFMQPDCQSISKCLPVHQLPYFAAHIPIKNMQTNFTELTRLEGNAANYVINEHVLTIYISEKILDTLKSGRIPFDFSDTTSQHVTLILNKYFLERLQICRWKMADPIPAVATASELFEVMHDIMLKLVESFNRFLKDLALNQAAVEDYNGPLCGFHDFLLPFLRALRSELPCFPRSPIFLLLDDADNLNLAQTRLLNSWISTRTHSEVSIKVSTQLRYKTFLSHTGRSIDSPHDFSEIQISTIYTSNHRKYYDRVCAIVTKRLTKANILTSPEDFFPEDEEQKKEIDSIKLQIQNKWERGEGRGNRSRDDVTRYARPEYIKRLGGSKKASSKYSYSGFSQLVSISSGVIRCFLEPASQMFSEQKGEAKKDIKCIEPRIQNQKIREFAIKFLHSDIEELKKRDETIEEDGLTLFEKLENLLHAMGGTFMGLMDSDRAERRVFSIAFSDRPDKDVLSVLKLGVEEGYFHESTIGNKEGNGRTRLFILNRRIAPCFNLDPTSFAGYLFVTNDKLKRAMYNATSYLRDLEKLGSKQFFDNDQLDLFQQ
jgi:hypothetical protein